MNVKTEISFKLWSACVISFIIIFVALDLSSVTICVIIHFTEVYFKE